MEEAIEILEELKIKDYFKCKRDDKVVYFKIKKSKLIDFCIQLLKIIMEDQENANNERN